MPACGVLQYGAYSCGALLLFQRDRLLRLPLLLLLLSSPVHMVNSAGTESIEDMRCSSNFALLHSHRNQECMVLVFSTSVCTGGIFKHGFSHHFCSHLLLLNCALVATDLTPCRFQDFPLLESMKIAYLTHRGRTQHGLCFGSHNMTIVLDDVFESLLPL